MLHIAHFAYMRTSAQGLDELASCTAHCYAKASKPTLETFGVRLPGAATSLPRPSSVHNGLAAEAARHAAPACLHSRRARVIDGQLQALRSRHLTEPMQWRVGKGARPPRRTRCGAARGMPG